MPPGTRLRRAVLVLVGVVVLTAGVVTAVVVRNGPSPVDACADIPPVRGTSVGSRPFVGTLGTHADTAADESRAGVKMAMVELGWRDFEPRRGEFDAGYAQRVCRRVADLHEAGMQVTLGLGLHYTPPWVLAINGSRLTDQHGTTSRAVDLVFNRDMRRLAQRYLARVAADIGLQHFWAVRVTSGGNSELVYPPGGGYWAFSDGAQNGPQQPATMQPNPLPGWRPGTGDTSPSVDDRQRWARWYVAALADVADWQMEQLRSLGFTGYLQVVTPGQGLRPTQLPARIAKGLPDGLLGRGAVWSWVYGDLRTRDAVTAYVSSVADGSGGDDGCGPDDGQVTLDSRAVFDWSAARWIARVAGENGFTVAGEVPGYRDSSSRRAYYADPSADGLAARAYAQASACGFLGLYWAHDDQVRDGTVQLSSLGALAGSDPSPPAAATR